MNTPQEEDYATLQMKVNKYEQGTRDKKTLHCHH